jgi:uncharacterized repeat protein (TIGR03803 family)
MVLPGAQRNSLLSPSSNLRFAASLIGVVFCLVWATVAAAQTYSTVASFDESNGKAPTTPLVQGIDGNFYGTTQLGGAHSFGVVFAASPTGTITPVYSFCSQSTARSMCYDGMQPIAALAVGINGNLYGTASSGGADCAFNGSLGCGTVFEVTPAGQFTTLYRFCKTSSTCADGAYPYGNLLLASNGNFYGTTSQGGAYNGGTVFEITPAGKLTTLYSFCSQANCADGNYPVTGLIETNGKLYGTTYDGGTVPCSYFKNGSGCGTIFEMTLEGKLTTLYSFGTDAGLLQVPLALASNGNFYGTSANGGTGDCKAGCGTIFEITPSGDFTTLYNFCTNPVHDACADGGYPLDPLIQATDGNLYGTTSAGGYTLEGADGGTIFSITPQGDLTTLWTVGQDYVFASGPDGGMIQATNGNFYGTTQTGGTDNQGTVFEFSMGLGPFVETVPTSGRAGAKVLILGTDLQGVSSVAFSGTSATFSVVSATEIQAIVPAGATTGQIAVVTSSGTLDSISAFQILP